MIHELKKWAETVSRESKSKNRQLAKDAGCYFETSPDGRRILHCKPSTKDHNNVFDIGNNAKGQGVEQIDTISDEAKAMLLGDMRGRDD